MRISLLSECEDDERGIKLEWGWGGGLEVERSPWIMMAWVMRCRLSCVMSEEKNDGKLRNKK